MTPRPTFIIKKCPNVIILLHGFNSAPGKKSKQIQEFLKENNLKHEYELIIPKMSGEPRSAIREINKIIRSNKGIKVHLIGTSLGGFYANYFRAKFKEDFLIVHAINPSWNPSESLRLYKNKELKNLKTKEKWTFKNKYIEQLIEFEGFIKKYISIPPHKEYYIHISKHDELLNFEKMYNFMEINKVPFQKTEYETDHRFDKIKEVMKIVIRHKI
tara:strand:+ start:466 stop:1110 length:645 start_codon:yes stop_codon:yes gene_type:complete